MRTTITMAKEKVKNEDPLKAGIKGKIKINSTSKIKKINAIKKNRIEKGRRAEYLGVNPHSKGLIFSRSCSIFILNAEPRNKSKKDTKPIIKKFKKIFITLDIKFL